MFNFYYASSKEIYSCKISQGTMDVMGLFCPMMSFTCSTWVQVYFTAHSVYVQCKIIKKKENIKENCDTKHFWEKGYPGEIQIFLRKRLSGWDFPGDGLAEGHQSWFKELLSTVQKVLPGAVSLPTLFILQLWKHLIQPFRGARQLKKN